MENVIIKKEKAVRTAEVFTPPFLTKEILDEAPVEIWQENMTFCDPACGNGNLLVEVLKRKISLGHSPLEALKTIYGADIIKNSIEECQRRLLEVIKSVEKINKKHLQIVTRNIVFLDIKTYPKGSLQYDFSFSNLDDFDFWAEKISYFDVIIMNPPYHKEQKKGKTGGTVFLWKRFMDLALNLTKENGYIISINPSSWRQPGEKLYSLFASYNLLYLKIFSIKEVRKIFDVFMLLDCYILQKTKNYSSFKMVDINKNIYNASLLKFPFLPNCAMSEIEEIMAKEGEERCPAYYDGMFHDSKTDILKKQQDTIFIYPCVYSMNKGNRIKYLYSKIKPNNVPKVICSIGGHPYPLNDFKGELGLTNKTFGIKIDSFEEGENIVKALNSEKFSEILKGTKWCTYHVNYKIFAYYRRNFWKNFL